MQIEVARPRFQFLAQALHGSAGFAPRVTYRVKNGLSRPAHIDGPCFITPYPRESPEKFAARVASAVYENHLRHACERFAAYLGRKSPARTGTDNPLVRTFLEDADNAGAALPVLLHRLCIDVKARGSMLVLMDMPRQRHDRSLGDALHGTQRVVPYIKTIAPETVAAFEQDEHGCFTRLDIHAQQRLPNGQTVDVIRRWDERGWAIMQGNNVLDSGEHPFGQCPVLAITENGSPFPHIGRFTQIADLSLRMYNAQSELDEILRGQTFSLLTLQIPPEASNAQDMLTQASVSIGTNNLLVHQGSTPAFIAPDGGPAQTYLARIAALQAAIERISMETASHSSAQAESGQARKMRFEALNADLASFAQLMQELERRIWALLHQALGIACRVEVEWPTDYNLTDSAAELDILALMQATSFPEAVLQEKRRAITLSEFDRADPDTLARLMAALDEQAQESSAP